MSKRPKSSGTRRNPKRQLKKESRTAAGSPAKAPQPESATREAAQPQSAGSQAPKTAKTTVPTLIFAGEKAPLSAASTTHENLTEGYLHSLIDQLHQLVSQLKTERAFLETVLKQMPCGVMIADAPSGRLRSPNDMVDEIMREPFYPARSVEDYRHWKGFHADGRPYEPQEWPMARAIKYGEEVREEEIRILRGDGTYGYIEVNAAPICNEKKQIVAGIVTFSDISERKAARKGIRENVERLRLAQVATGIGFWENDLATGKVIWSEETYRLFGQDALTFKPSTESFLECVHAADRERVRAHVQQMKTYRKELRIEFCVQWPDESVHWVEERSQPFLFNGDPVRIFGVTIDVTQRKRLEEHLASERGVRPARRKAKAASSGESQGC